jgi:hypothetical protein
MQDAGCCKEKQNQFTLVIPVFKSKVTGLWCQMIDVKWE